MILLITLINSRKHLDNTSINPSKDSIVALIIQSIQWIKSITLFKSKICKSGFYQRTKSTPTITRYYVFELVNLFNFLSLSVSTIALDATQTPTSTEPHTTHSPDITSDPVKVHHPDLNQLSPTPTAKVWCQTNTQPQDDSQQTLQYFSIFDPPKHILKKASKTLNVLAVEIAQYDEDMYVALEADNDTPLKILWRHWWKDSYHFARMALL